MPECDICYESRATLKTHCRKDVCQNCLLHLSGSDCPFCRKKGNFMQPLLEVNFEKLKFRDFVYNSALINKSVICLPKESGYNMEFSYFKTYTTPDVFQMKYIKTYPSAYMMEPILQFQFEHEKDKETVQITFSRDKGNKFIFLLLDTIAPIDLDENYEKILKYREGLC